MHQVCDRFIKEELRNKIVIDLRTGIRSNSDVDVNGTSRIPAGVNCGEVHYAVCISDLIAAQELFAYSIIGGHIRVKPERVTMPDVYMCTSQRGASRAAQLLHCNSECQRK